MTKIFLSVLLMLFTASAFAQLSKADEQVLSEELLRLVNELRSKQGLALLLPDPKLAEAAKLHSDYMAKKNDFSHEEKSAATKDPKKRVEKAGGKEFDYVGENILQTVPQVFPLKSKQLKELAGSMFLQWKNSPGHYANMINSEYTFCDFGFTVHSKTKAVYATQVFAKKGVLISGQLSKNGFGVRPGNCESLLADYSNVFSNMGNSIVIDGNEILFAYHNIELFKSILTGSRDGIAIDLIADSQMACGHPNQMDLSPVYDGVMLAPVYRDALLANNRAESDYRIITPLGVLPEQFRQEYFSISLIFIKDGMECAYRIPIEVPSRDYELSPITPVLTNPEVTLSASGITRSEEVKFDFQRNVTGSRNVPVVKAAKEKIIAIDITSYSSVEGSTANNTELQNERAQFIRQELHKQLRFTDGLVNVQTMENWPQMLFQVDYFDILPLIGQSRDSIKAYLMVTKSAEWDSLLFAQRRSSATIHYEGTLPANFSKKDFQSLNLRTAVITGNDQLANKALHELFYSRDTVFEALFEQRIFLSLTTNPALVQNASAVFSKSPDQDLYRITEFISAWIRRLDELSPEAQFNLLNLYTLVSSRLMNEWDLPSRRLSKVVHPKKMEKAVNLLNRQELLLNFHLSAINYYGQVNDEENLERSFDFIAGHFRKATLTQEEEINLVLFYNNWSCYHLTIAQLLPKINQSDFPVEEAYILAKTAFGYQHSLNDEQLEKISALAFELDPEQWCEWIYYNPQLKRYPYIKSRFCSSCGEE